MARAWAAAHTEVESLATRIGFPLITYRFREKTWSSDFKHINELGHKDVANKVLARFTRDKLWARQAASSSSSSSSSSSNDNWRRVDDSMVGVDAHELMKAVASILTALMLGRSDELPHMRLWCGPGVACATRQQGLLVGVEQRCEQQESATTGARRVEARFRAPPVPAALAAVLACPSRWSDQTSCP